MPILTALFLWFHQLRLSHYLFPVCTLLICFNSLLQGWRETSWIILIATVEEVITHSLEKAALDWLNYVVCHICAVGQYCTLASPWRILSMRKSSICWNDACFCCFFLIYSFPTLYCSDCPGRYIIIHCILEPQ